MLIGLSIINIKNINQIWDKNPFLRTGIAKIMSRDKFKVIDKFFHLNNNL